MIISIYFTDKWLSMLNTIYLYILVSEIFYPMRKFKVSTLSETKLSFKLWVLIKCMSNIISIIALWAQPVRGVATVQVVNYTLWQRPSIDHNFQSEKWESAGIFLP